MKTVKHYWVSDDGRTNISFGNNWMDTTFWHEVTKEEYEAAMSKILAKWAKRGA